jgi:hypothetical protein
MRCGVATARARARARPARGRARAPATGLRCAARRARRRAALLDQLQRGETCCRWELCPRAGIAVEFSHRRSLLLADTPGHNLRACIALGPHRRSCHAAKHRQLPDMRQCVCKRSLNESFDRACGWVLGSKLAIERRKGGKESLDLGVPIVTSSGLPDIVASCQRDRPRHEVRHMCHDLNRSSTCGSEHSGPEASRHVTEHLCGAISQGCDEVSHDRARRVRSRVCGRICCGHCASVRLDQRLGQAGRGSDTASSRHEGQGDDKRIDGNGGVHATHLATLVPMASRHQPRQ